MEAKTDVLQKLPFRLIVNHPGQADATMELAWCLDKEMIQLLQGKRIRNPYLLIVVAEIHRTYPYHKEISRSFIPLSQGLKYIEFPRPGKFAIAATIIWSKKYDRLRKDAERSLASNLFCRFGRGYSLELVNGYSDSVFSFEELNASKEVASLSDTEHEQQLAVVKIHINVSADLFAKEPPRWLWWWTNLWHESTPRNECFWRRRFFVAFIIQPPCVALWILLKAIICLVGSAFLFFIGRRYISLKPIIHPFYLGIDEISDASDDDDNYYTSTKIDGTKRPVFWRILITPGYWLLAAILNFGSLLLIPSQQLLGAIIGIPIFMIGIALLSLIIKKVGASKKWREGNERRQKKRAAKKERRIARETQQLQQHYEKNLTPLACDNGGPKEASLNALPSTHQTFHLRFLALKKKVCKPFAR